MSRTATALMLAAALAAADTAPDGAAPAPAGAATSAAPTASQTISQASYILGMQVASKVKEEGLDVAQFQAGMADAFANAQPKIAPAEYPAIMERWQQERQTAAEAAGQAQIAGNAAFLAENAKKEGVTTTKSGLQYAVIASGKGKTPAASNRVKVNYTGTFTDGTKFDASADHGGPAEFQVGGVIRGWTEALQLMKEGDRWRLWIPSDLAYGESAPPSIGPNRLLVFEVELLEVLP
jgi:FKBP-type peptidyl-prolyl cis-trans isomerase